MMKRWFAHFDIAPYSTPMAVAGMVVGAETIVLGSKVSEAISNVLPGDIITHIWGGILFVASVIMLVGIRKLSWLAEYIGLRLIVAVMAFYAACCYIGLGVGGSVSGSFALVYALGSWRRSRKLFQDAKENVELKHNGNDAPGRRSDAE